MLVDTPSIYLRRPGRPAFLFPTNCPFEFIPLLVTRGFIPLDSRHVSRRFPRGPDVEILGVDSVGVGDPAEEKKRNEGVMSELARPRTGSFSFAIPLRSQNTLFQRGATAACLALTRK
jgi:hypothetical protein